MYLAYLVLLFVGGLIAAIIGTLLPGGGGWTLAVLGCVSIGAWLVLIGISLKAESEPRPQGRSQRIER